MENEIKKDDALSVTQLTMLIKTMLEGSFSNVLLKGEISNFRPNPTGHLYFTLKDNESQISAVMFRGRAAYLDFTPKDGMLVQVQGSISVYAARGNYQIIINKMSKAGAGDIMEMIEERKKKLYAEGLFDQSKKKKLPLLPKTIGVVTSPTGAALRDILNVTKSRNPKMSVTVLPAIVQGEEAAPSIIRMIKTANKYKMCDVLIVGRGGGSLEDLLPFSDENVVRAVAESQIPVVSAVGHEIDWSLIDYASDVRASTPSHAAEICTPRLADLETTIESYKIDFYNFMMQKVENYKLMLKTFTPEGMENQFRQIEQPLSFRLSTAKDNLVLYMNKMLDDKKNTVKQCKNILESSSPQSIFDRGYSMVQDEETGKIIRSGSQVQPGSKLIIKPSAGKILAQVVNSTQEG